MSLKWVGVKTEDGRATVLTMLVYLNENMEGGDTVFYDFDDQGFTWDWEATQDGGKTWTLNWRINYKKVK